MKYQDLRDDIQSVFLGNSLEKLREEILDSFFKILSATDPTKDIKGAEFIEEKIPEISKVYSAQKKFINYKLREYENQQTLDETFEEEAKIFKIKERISLGLELMETASYKDFKILKKKVRNLYREKHNEESYKAQQKEYYEKFLEKYNKLNQQWEAIQKLLVSSKKSSEQKNENNGNIVDEEGLLEGPDIWIKKLKMIASQKKYSLLNNGSEEQKLESKLNELIKKQQKKTTTVNELIELFKKLNESEEEKIQSKKEEKTIEEQAKEGQTKEEQAKEEQERFIYKIEKQITKDFNWLLLAEHDKDEKADADKKNIKNLYELYPKILKIFEKKLKAIEVLKRIPEEYYDQEDQLNKIHNQIQPLNDLASIVFKDIWGGKIY